MIPVMSWPSSQRMSAAYVQASSDRYCAESLLASTVAMDGFKARKQCQIKQKIMQIDTYLHSILIYSWNQMHSNETHTLQIINLFYRNLTKNLPNRPKLIRHFQKFVDNCQQEIKSVVRESKSVNRFLTTSSRQISSEVDAKSVRSKRKQQLSQASELGLKIQKMFGCDWLFVSKNYERVLVYGILYSFISNENLLAFQVIEERINNILEENNTFNITSLRAITFEWSRVGQIILTKRKIRWQKMLHQSVSKFPDQFVTLLFSLISKKDVSSESVPFQMEMLKGISKQFKVKINYFAINCRKLTSTQRMGVVGETQINLGNLVDTETYVISNKMPVLSEQDAKREVLSKKILICLDEILKEYQTNTRKLISLDSVTQVASKESKIQNYLEGKK